ncbi:MAG: hypothetical protein R6V05_03865 [Candidatus Brocadiia bacterium]
MRRATIKCRDCGASLSVYDHQVGRLGECPRCGATMRIAAAMFGDIEEGGGWAEAGPVATPLIAPMDWLVGRLRFLRRFPGRFDAYMNVLGRLGLLGTLLAGAVMFLHLTVRAIRVDSMFAFLTGLGGALTAVVLHYVAARFLNAGRDLLHNNPQMIMPDALLDSLGLLGVLATLTLLVLTFTAGVQAAQQDYVLELMLRFMWLLGATVLAFHLTLCFLNPTETMNVHAEVADATGGEMALGILRVIGRCVLALVPLVLAVGVLGAASAMVLMMIMAWAGEPLGELMFGPAALVASGSSASPIAIYLAFVVYVLILDLYQAILQIARNTQPAE